MFLDLIVEYRCEDILTMSYNGRRSADAAGTSSYDDCFAAESRELAGADFG